MSSHMRRRIHVKSYEEEDTCRKRMRNYIRSYFGSQKSVP